MLIMSCYLAEPFFAAMDAKTPEERQLHKEEFQRRKQWYLDQNLSMEKEPDGSHHDIDDDSIWWASDEEKRGPELWPEGWKPK